MAARSVRDLKGLTNASLARRLGWDDRAVTNAFTECLPLKAAKALALWRAILKTPTGYDGKRFGRQEAVEIGKILREVAPVLAEISGIEQPLPAALIAPEDVERMAEMLAKRLPGLPEQRRAACRSSIAATLRREGAGFAFAAYQRFTSETTPLDENAAESALARFGYAVSFGDTRKSEKT